MAMEEDKYDANAEQVDDIDVNDDEDDEKYEEGQEIDVLKDGGIIKKIIRKGEGWKTPKKGADVTVHYVGTLTNGDKFDSSRDRADPFKFKLGLGQVIKGWDEGVKSMRKGELSVFTLKPEYAYGETGSPPKIPGNSTLIFEVELLSWREDVDVTKDGQVTKIIENEGEGYETPKDDTSATINYKAKYNGKVFEEKNNFEFVIGSDSVVSGLDKAVEGMKKGEKSIIKVNSKYGYGSSGNTGLSIPADANLEYEVELVDFVKEKNSWEMSADEKFAACEKSRIEGNELFKAGNIKRAAKKYKKALGFVDSDYSLTDEQKKKAKDLKLPCLSNSAACKLKLKQWREAIEDCKKVLEIEPSNVKALFRRGQAYNELDEWDLSKDDLKRALELEPNNSEVKRELAKVQRKITQHTQKEKKKFQNMFQKLSAMEESEQEQAAKRLQEEQRQTPNTQESATASESKGDKMDTDDKSTQAPKQESANTNESKESANTSESKEGKMETDDQSTKIEENKSQ